MSASTRAPVVVWPGSGALASLRSAARAAGFMRSPPDRLCFPPIDSRCRARCPARRTDPSGDVSWKKAEAGELRAPRQAVRRRSTLLWEAGRRVQGDLPARQSQAECNVHRSADLMSAGGVDAVKVGTFAPQ